MQKRKIHTKAFKLEAVRLLDRGDKTAAELARELSIRRNQPVRRTGWVAISGWQGGCSVEKRPEQ